MKHLFQVLAYEHPKGILVADGYVVDPDADAELVVGPVFVQSSTPAYAGIRVTQENPEVFKGRDMNRIQFVIAQMGTMENPTRLRSTE